MVDSDRAYKPVTLTAPAAPPDQKTPSEMVYRTVELDAPVKDVPSARSYSVIALLNPAPKLMRVWTGSGWATATERAWTGTKWL